MPNKEYKKHYNIEFDDEKFRVTTIDEDGPYSIENTLLVPTELADRYITFRRCCNGKSTDSMNFASKSSYYQKLSELFYDMAIWQMAKENEDMKLLGKDVNSELDYSEFRNLSK